MKLEITPESVRSAPGGRIRAETADKPGNGDKEFRDTIIEGIDKLSPLPQVVFRVQELIASAESSAREIAKEIETDQAIATKVLRIANSAYYGMGGKISSVQHASVVLGYKTLGEIVTIAGAEGTLEGKLPGYGYDTMELWEHSLAVAFGSRIIAEMKQPAMASEAYTAGLIHDIGKIILDPYIAQRKNEIAVYMESDEKTFLEAEKHFFSFNHAEIAHAVCQKWNFPDTITSAIRFHHTPSASEDNLLAHILHLADQQARMTGAGYDEDDYLYETEAGTMDFLGLSSGDANKISLEMMETTNRFSS